MACCTSLFCPSSCHIDELCPPWLMTGFGCYRAAGPYRVRAAWTLISIKPGTFDAKIRSLTTINDVLLAETIIGEIPYGVRHGYPRSSFSSTFVRVRGRDPCILDEIALGARRCSRHVPPGRADIRRSARTPTTVRAELSFRGKRRRHVGELRAPVQKSARARACVRSACRGRRRRSPRRLHHRHHHSR